jgi:hypothetical protein
MQQKGIEGPPPDFSTREQKIAEAQSLGDMLEAEMKRREQARLERVANAQVRASNAAAAASSRGGGGDGGDIAGKAPSGYQWVRGASGAVELAPIKGGPADAARLQPGELKQDPQ